MIAGCIERIRRRGCAGCARREPCAEMSRLFGIMLAPRPPAPLRGDGPGAVPAGPFLSLLDRLTRSLQQQALEAVAPRRATPFRTRVEQCIEPLLPSGAVGVERVARSLGCSRQTLYRRLKVEDVTFEQVLDALRRRLALRYIRGERMGVKQAAYRLGYSDPAAFSRAFKRWTGRSPGAAAF